MKNSINIIENKIINYTDTMYKSGPIKTSDFISDKYDNIHEQLYNEALSQYIASLDVDADEFRGTHRFIEIKDSEYYKPSKVMIISQSYPYKRETVDLSKWWYDYTGDVGNKDISELYINEDTIPDAEIVYIDYNKGEAKFKSRVTGEEFWAGFDYINSNTKVSADLSLKNTFTYLFNNKIYGYEN